MMYGDARPKIKSGDLLAWSHRESMWSSWYNFKISIVRMFTKSEYSHVGLALVLSGRVFVLEAVMPKIRIFPLSKCGDFYWLPLKARWLPKTEELALWKVGEDYSQAHAIQAFYSTLNPDDVSECAAYVTHVLKKDGIDLGNRATPDAVVFEAQQRAGVHTIYVTQP